MVRELKCPAARLSNLQVLPEQWLWLDYQAA
jgi:hypothetical protein